MALPPNLPMLPPHPRDLPHWWKEEFDHLIIYARHSPMIPDKYRADMSLVHQAMRTMFYLRLTTATIRGVEERYGQLRVLAPWLLPLIIHRSYGWTNKVAWEDMLPGLGLSEVSSEKLETKLKSSELFMETRMNRPSTEHGGRGSLIAPPKRWKQLMGSW